MFFNIIVYATLHGLVLTPVMLSLVPITPPSVLLAAQAGAEGGEVKGSQEESDLESSPAMDAVVSSSAEIEMSS